MRTKSIDPEGYSFLDCLPVVNHFRPLAIVRTPAAARESAAGGGGWPLTD